MNWSAVFFQGWPCVTKISRESRTLSIPKILSLVDRARQLSIPRANLILDYIGLQKIQDFFEKTWNIFSHRVCYNLPKIIIFGPKFCHRSFCPNPSWWSWMFESVNLWMWYIKCQRWNSDKFWNPVNNIRIHHDSAYLKLHDRPSQNQMQHSILIHPFSQVPSLNSSIEENWLKVHHHIIIILLILDLFISVIHHDEICSKKDG